MFLILKTDEKTIDSNYECAHNSHTKIIWSCQSLKKKEHISWILHWKHLALFYLDFVLIERIYFLKRKFERSYRYRIGNFYVFHFFFVENNVDLLAVINLSKYERYTSFSMRNFMGFFLSYFLWNFTGIWIWIYIVLFVGIIAKHLFRKGQYFETGYLNLLYWLSKSSQY